MNNNTSTQANQLLAQYCPDCCEVPCICKPRDYLELQHNTECPRCHHYSYCVNVGENRKEVINCNVCVNQYNWGSIFKWLLKKGLINKQLNPLYGEFNQILLNTIDYFSGKQKLAWKEVIRIFQDVKKWEVNLSVTRIAKNAGVSYKLAALTIEFAWRHRLLAQVKEGNRFTKQAAQWTLVKPSAALLQVLNTVTLYLKRKNLTSGIIHVTGINVCNLAALAGNQCLGNKYGNQCLGTIHSKQCLAYKHRNQFLRDKQAYIALNSLISKKIGLASWSLWCYLNSEAGPVSLKSICEHFSGITHQSAYRHLTKLINLGLVCKPERGYYEAIPLDTEALIENGNQSDGMESGSQRSSCMAAQTERERLSVCDEVCAADASRSPITLHPVGTEAIEEEAPKQSYPDRWLLKHQEAKESMQPGPEIDCWACQYGIGSHTCDPEYYIKQWKQRKRKHEYQSHDY